MRAGERMMFFDDKGNRIQCQEWLKIYEPYYFLNCSTRGHRIHRGNQTSRFVENQVCALLTQTTPFSKDDLILAIAWKIGLIDHRSSEASKKIKYLRDWPTALKDRYGHDFSVSIPSLAASMPTILTQLGQGNPQYLFDLHSELDGFGPVFILTVLFFVSHGRFPIYDRFAHIAALAIAQGLPPGSFVDYRAVQKWNDFQHYMNLLLPISHACPQGLGTPSMSISRLVDRALWVYGHFFETGPHPVRKTKSRGTQSSTPIIASSSGVLLGRLRDLCQHASDGWRRREIIIRQGANGYPRERDRIHLVDSSGASYRDLSFIKGAGVQGHVCLGKPGTLKEWFTRRYPVGEIKVENVYFEPTERSNEYRIYSELEWKARKS
jgi:hypothetical protein